MLEIVFFVALANTPVINRNNFILVKIQKVTSKSFIISAGTTSVFAKSLRFSSNVFSIRNFSLLVSRLLNPVLRPGYLSLEYPLTYLKLFIFSLTSRAVY